MTVVGSQRLDPRLVSLVWAGPDRAAEFAEMHARLFTPGWSEASFVEALSHPGATAFLARVREDVDALPEPAGFIVGRLAADEAEILTLGVLERWQRRGIGTLLVQGLARAIARAEARRLFLEVASDNTVAFELYRGLGFTAVNLRKGYYERPGQPAVDALVLALPLDK